MVIQIKTLLVFPTRTLGASNMETSLMVEAFKEVNHIASWILRQRKNPLRNGIVLSSEPKQGKEGNVPAETELVARPREIKPTRGSTIPPDGLRTADLKRKNPMAHKGKNQPGKRSSEIKPGIDWGENRDCLSGPLEQFLLWCNEFEDEQLKTIVKETEEIHSAMKELFLKIAKRLIDILDCDSAPENVKKSVRNAQRLKVKYDHESSRGGSPQPHTYFNDPEDLMESLRTNVSHLYELGPAITALLVEFQDRERSPKRTKSEQLVKTLPNQGDPITALRTSIPQRHRKPDTAKSSSSPSTTSEYSHNPEGPSPKRIGSARTPQGSAISFKTMPLELLKQTSRKASSEFESGRTFTGRRSLQSMRDTIDDLPGNFIPKGSPDANAEMIPTKKIFWYKVEMLKITQSLQMQSGRHISISFSSDPFDKHAVQKAIMENLSGAQDRNPPADTVNILCDDWCFKLESRDDALPAEFATQFIAPHWPKVARQLCPQSLEALDTSLLLDTMEEVHDILTTLWTSTLYNVKDNETIAKTLLLLAYVSLCERLWEASNIFWDRICSSDKPFRDPHTTEWQQIYLENLDGWLEHDKYVPRCLRNEAQPQFKSRLLILKRQISSLVSQTPRKNRQFAKRNVKQKDSSEVSLSDGTESKASFRNEQSYLLFLVRNEQKRYNKMDFDRKKVGDFLSETG